MARKKDYRKAATNRALEYVRKVENHCPTLTKLGRNLTKAYLEGKLDEVYNRDTIVVEIQKILLRKSKANVLLTGPAGCGKTAIAERLAAVLANRSIAYCENDIRETERYEKALDEWRKNPVYDDDGDYSDEYLSSQPMKNEVEKPYQSEIVLFELSLTSLAAGMRYVGDIEERVDKVIAECRAIPNVVLFIDEIHQIVGCGKGEHSNAVAQMFKPALARREMCVVGATTTEEAEVIRKDKALARRFNEIAVRPLAGDGAVTTADNILADYSKYHGVAVEGDVSREIISALSTLLPKSVFPDNFINVVDETLAGAKFDGYAKVDMSHFTAVLSRMAGAVS